MEEFQQAFRMVRVYEHRYCDGSLCYVKCRYHGDYLAFFGYASESKDTGGASL